MPPSILVVDDHAETCAMIARTLAPRGYEVVTVANGAAAFIAAAAQRPDLAIVDMLLPAVDGLTVIETLRQQQPRLPVIAISAVHDVLERPGTVPAGLDPASMAFLTKPFALTALMALVRQLLPVPEHQRSPISPTS